MTEIEKISRDAKSRSSSPFYIVMIKANKMREKRVQ